MALKPCRECGQQVSDSAPSCPHCGYGDPSGRIAVGKAQEESVGKAAAILHQAKRTDFVDAMTGTKLADYSARSLSDNIAR